MTWQIEYSEAQDLVTVTVKGQINAAETAKMALEGIALARENNSNRFLIDYSHTQVQDTSLDTYEFMSGLEQLGIKRSDHIAFIIVRNKEAHHFAETVAANRGWINLRYFSTREEALTWLDAKGE